MTLAVRAGCGLLALSATLALAQSPARPDVDANRTGYQDRVIEGLPPLAEDDGATADAYDRSGWPRLLRLETRLGTPPFDSGRQTQVAYAVYGLLDTPNHGALSIDGSLTPSDRRHSLTLRQRELPLPGGWLGHHGLGVIDAPANGLTRHPSRVLVPTTQLLGLSGEWEHTPSGLSLLAASGEPGQLTSQPANGFEGLGGRRSVLGAQWHLGGSGTAPQSQPVGTSTASDLPGWTLGLQHERAQRATDTQPAEVGSGPLDANATLLHLRHEGADLRAQGQLLRSRSDGQGAQGAWIDIDGEDGPRRHGLSLYRLEPGLSWAGLTLPSDVQGVTLRSEWRTRQWSAEGSYDWLSPINGGAARGSYASGSAHWRLDRQTRFSTGASVRRFDGNAWTGYLDGRFQNGWGMGGLRLTLAGGDSNQSPAQVVAYDQEWLAPLGWTVSSSLGVGRYAAQGDVAADRFWSAALALSAPLGSRSSVRGNLGTEQRTNGQSRHNLNLSAQWRLSPRWSLDGSYTRAIGRSPTVRPLDPLAPVVEESDTSSDRSFQAVLRYETSAGSRSVPLGGRASEGGGRIEGTVFFDANRSGTQDASETGAPGVTVALDNRYAVRTDAQGRFSFPFVAAGPRTVSVRNETLPLPWGVVDEGQVKIDVRLRETTQIFLPVQRAD